MKLTCYKRKKEDTVEPVFPQLFDLHPWEHLHPVFGDSWENIPRHHAPFMHFQEDNEEFTVELPLPGVKKKDVKIELKDRDLIICFLRVEKRSHTEQSFKHRRSITLPPEVDTTNIKAKLEDGLLKITLPKKASYQPREIPVE